MIELTLLCHDGHRFNAWFPDSAAFESQNERGLVSCPECGSLKVSKGLQRPSVVGGRDRSRAAEASPTSANAASPVPSNIAPQSGPELSSDQASGGTPVSAEQVAQMHAFVTAMRRVKAYVEQNFDDVGSEFSEEARKIHYGESEERGIYGQASSDDIEELLDEGIDIMPLPKLPELDS